MNPRRSWLLRSLSLALLLPFLSLLTACKKNEAPKPVEIGQIPTFLQEAFKGAKDPIAGMASELVAAVEQKEWPKASVAAQALSTAASLTTKQREAVGRCLIAINNQVNEAAAAGNNQAEEVRRMIRQDK